MTYGKMLFLFNQKLYWFLDLLLQGKGANHLEFDLIKNVSKINGYTVKYLPIVCGKILLMVDGKYLPIVCGKIFVPYEGCELVGLSLRRMLPGKIRFQI